MINHKLDFDSFKNCLRDFDFIDQNGKKDTGMEMFYLNNNHPCLHFKFNHKNKQKAWKQFKNLCNSDFELKKTYIMGVYYTYVNDFVN